MRQVYGVGQKGCWAIEEIRVRFDVVLMAPGIISPSQAKQLITEECNAWEESYGCNYRLEDENTEESLIQTLELLRA